MQKHLLIFLFVKKKKNPIKIVATIHINKLYK
jgi:hypothetical protein